MQTSFKPVVLVFTILAPEDAARMATSAELIEAPTDDARRQAVAEHGHRIDVLLTIGSIGLTRDEIAAMPKLALISALGAGFEKIDIEAARERAIPVVNGAGSNDQSVADHTFAVLAALGARGFLVNIARGSVVDTQALGHALRNGVIGGAGLDVYESEPAPPTALFDCPNLVLTPHVAGWSPEAIEATVTCFLDNLARLGAGQPLRNLV